MENTSAEKYSMELNRNPLKSDKEALRIINNYVKGKKYNSLNEVFKEQLENPHAEDVFKIAIMNYRTNTMRDLENSI